MKNLFLCVTTLLLLTFTSCRDERENSSVPNPPELRLQVEVNRIGSGLHEDVRSIVIEDLEEESRVNDLHLLFFKKRANGSATFTGYHAINEPITLNSNFRLEYNKINSGNYTVLAFANINGYYINSSEFAATSVDDFFAGLTPATTEEEVIKNTHVFAKSVATGFADQAIKRDNIMMSGSAEKIDGEQLITLKLTRALSRFDVQLLDDDYEIASVSVWNNALKTPLWLSAGNASQETAVNPVRFYGLENATNARKIEGLYAFENYTSSVEFGDNTTTCLIVGLRKEGTTHYYRVNINPEESGQSLKRNYVYQLTIRSVLAEGKANEGEAYNAKIEPNLSIDINNWTLDNEGLILTDGNNTLAVPSKIIRFAQEGGTRQYTLFTQGEGTLNIAPHLPGGFNASLSGNQLTVVANDLGALKNREGTLDVSFGGLKGTVQVIQELKELHFLKPDKTLISGFPASRNTKFTGEITITSSRDWEAKIFNTAQSGFSFDKDSSQDETSGISGDVLKLYIAKDNPTEDIKTGFVLISLKDVPGYSRVVMLKQSPSSDISIDLGTLTHIRFKANGAPSTIPNAVAGDAYEFAVDPGKDVNDNFFEWGAELVGADKDKFELTVNNEATAITPGVRISPKGNTLAGTPHASYPHCNFTLNSLTDVELKIYSGNSLAAVQSDPGKCKTVPVLQDAVKLSVADVTLSKKGETKDVNVTISEGFSWKAEITEVNDGVAPAAKYAYIDHRGYLWDGSNKYSTVGGVISGQNSSAFKVGFDKILFPLVGVEPKLKLKIYLTEEPNVYKEVYAKQEALIPNDVSIANMVGTIDYSMIGSAYFAGYSTYIKNASFFGPSSNYCYANVIITNTNPKDLVIANEVVYLHAGSTKVVGTGVNYWSDATFATINTWRNSKKEAITVYAQDTPSSTLFKYTPFNSDPYTEATTPKTDTRKLDTNDSNIIKYLTQDGPFGTVTVASINGIGYIDATHSAITRASFEGAGGVPVITEATHPDNVLIGINPKENIVFIGEGQILGNNFTTDLTAATDVANRNRFLANFISYILRTAQYGSHFTDHFQPGATTYPFDKLGTTYPEPYE